MFCRYNPTDPHNQAGNWMLRHLRHRWRELGENAKNGLTNEASEVWKNPNYIINS